LDSVLGMSAFPQIPDVSLRRSEMTRWATLRHHELRIC
jgi:hypothetical protein